MSSASTPAGTGRAVVGASHPCGGLHAADGECSPRAAGAGRRRLGPDALVVAAGQADVEADRAATAVTEAGLAAGRALLAGSLGDHVEARRQLDQAHRLVEAARSIALAICDVEVRLSVRRLNWALDRLHDWLAVVEDFERSGGAR